MDSSRLDFSLDQLIGAASSTKKAAPSHDQAPPRRRNPPKGETRRRGGAPATGPIRRVERETTRDTSVRKEAPKKLTGIPSQYIAMPFVQPSNKLTPAEVALHTSRITKCENNDVVISFKDTDVLIAKAATGDLILNSGGFRTFSTKSVLCSALQPVGLRIDEDADGTWSVSDGRAFMQKFEDGMTVLQPGVRLTRHQLLARPSVILQFFQQKKAGLSKKTARRGQPHGRGAARSAHSVMTHDQEGRMATSQTELPVEGSLDAALTF